VCFFERTGRTAAVLSVYTLYVFVIASWRFPPPSKFLIFLIQ
jgi:hypothetical protein